MNQTEQKCHVCNELGCEAHDEMWKCDVCGDVIHLDDGIARVTLDDDVTEVCENCWDKYEVECKFCREPVTLKDAGHTGGWVLEYHHDECWDQYCRDQNEE